MMHVASRKVYSSNALSPWERRRKSYHRDSVTISFGRGLLEKAFEGGQPSHATLVSTIQYKSKRSFYYMILSINKMGAY